MSAEQISGLGVCLALFAVLVGIVRMCAPARPSRHTRTDPACTRYTPPTTRLGQRLHDQARGRACTICYPKPVRVTITAEIPDEMIEAMR